MRVGGGRPSPSNAAATAAPPFIAALAPLSPWELGAALAGRYSGAFLGGGATVEARRRLRRVGLGADLDGRYARGVLGGDDAVAGGLGLRLAADVRFAVAERVTLLVTGGAGGHWARVRRTPAVGGAVTRNDGGPSIAASGGALVRVGPGFVTVAVGYAWTPLAGAGLGQPRRRDAQCRLSRCAMASSPAPPARPCAGGRRSRASPSPSTR